MRTIILLCLYNKLIYCKY